MDYEYNYDYRYGMPDKVGFDGKFQTRVKNQMCKRIKFESVHKEREFGTPPLSIFHFLTNFFSLTGKTAMAII